MRYSVFKSQDSVRMGSLRVKEDEALMHQGMEDQSMRKSRINIDAMIF